MQIYVVKKDTDVKQLLAGAPAGTLQTLQRFNPHLDFKKLAPGAVVVIPKAAGKIGGAAGETAPVGADALAGFIAESKEALAASAKRVQQVAERSKAEEAALAVAAKSKAVKEAADKDAELRKLLDEAIKQAKEDSKSAAADVKAFDALANSALTALEALAKRLA
jgi:hypothetical protein